MTDTVKVVAKLTARSDKISEARALLTELAAASRGEIGCGHYEVLQNAAEPQIFVLFEEWSDAAALDAHNATAHVQAAFAKAPALLSAPPDLARYARIG